MAPAKAGRALAGVKVLALEASISGPHCSRLLADLGADVIKIEKPGQGDLVRKWDSAVRGMSSAFTWVNYNKRSLAVDIKKPAGRDIVRRIAARSDVLLENFAPGVAERLGLGHAEMCAVHPRLIYCSLSGYGQNGPYRDMKAYDILIQGEAGIIATTGYPDHPAKVGVSIVDLTSSMYCAVGILAALYQREHTGRGQYIDVSMFDSMLSWLGYFPHHFWHRGEEPERVGMQHHYVVPYGPYRAGDGVYVSFAVATPRDWEIFCREVIERPEWIADPRFQTTELRKENRKTVEGLIQGVFLQRTSREWLARLKASDLPHGEVRGIAEVLSHPQIAARNMIREVDSPVGRVPIIGSALRLSDSPERLDPVPALGQHNQEILQELGYSEAEVRQLQQDKVI